MKHFMLMVLCFGLLSCGSVSTDISNNVPTASTPVITRVDPTTAQAGDEITIIGLGFSIIAVENILHIGASNAAATSYTLLDGMTEGEIEELTFTLPDNITPDTYPIFLTVIDEPSNAATLTITP